MNPVRVILGVGTNLGDRSANLTAAKSAIANFIKIDRQSSIYETAPWGMLEQPDFLNQIWEGTTSLIPSDLLEKIKQVEVELGRIPTVLYGPRLIDIDILLYSNIIYKSAELTIPHPHISERVFVLAPLADLEPELIIPGLKNSVKELLAAHDQSGIKKVQ
jgi:2-amino-4-hydroxy-6-hydroxymethyldihydropteridine diphosphokinase